MEELTIRKDIVKQFSADRIAYLVYGFICKTISPGELADLHQWVAQSSMNQLLFAELLLPYNIRSVLSKQ